MTHVFKVGDQVNPLLNSSIGEFRSSDTCYIEMIYTDGTVGVRFESGYTCVLSQGYLAPVINDPATCYEDRLETAVKLVTRSLENLTILQLDHFVENYRGIAPEVDEDGEPIEDGEPV